MRDTRFVFVEGVMGAGKTTMVYSLVLHLRAEGTGTRAIWEGPTVDEPNHLLRMSTSLPHPYAPWEDLSSESYIEVSLSRWRQFAAEHIPSRDITICDGLLFHGNMTDLLLMDCRLTALEEYINRLLETLSSFRPAVIYLHQHDIRRALERVVEERGSEWQTRQAEWKLGSPFAMRHGWTGSEGLVALYERYRTVCDTIFASLTVPKLLVEYDGRWDAIYSRVADFLELPGRIRQTIP